MINYIDYNVTRLETQSCHGVVPIKSKPSLLRTLKL